MLKKKFRVTALCLAVSFLLGGCAVRTDALGTTKGDEKRHEIVVVGGGIAGLTAGYFLQDEDILILEKKDTVGGRTISSMNKSFTYAKGTEYLGTPEDILSEMIDELGLEPKEIPSPMDGYFDGDSFYYGSEGIKRYLINNSEFDAYGEFVDLVLDEYRYYDEIPDIDYDYDNEVLDYTTAREWLEDNGVPKVFIDKYNVSSKGLFGANLDDISALSFIPEAAYDFEDEDIDALDEEDYDYENYDEEDIAAEYQEALEEESGSY